MKGHHENGVLLFCLFSLLTAPNQVVREELEKKVACLKERQKELESIIDAANEMLDML